MHTERNLRQTNWGAVQLTNKPQPTTPHPESPQPLSPRAPPFSLDHWTNSDYHLNSWKGLGLFLNQLMVGGQGLCTNKFFLFIQQTSISAYFMLPLVLSAGDTEMMFICINSEIYGLPHKDV